MSPKRAAVLQRIADEVVARLEKRRPSIEPVIVRTMMRIEEVAERWCLNVKTVYAMIERGELQARRIGRVLRIPRFVVERFESQGRVAPERK
jgi:excisionase family DNA binding protein